MQRPAVLLPLALTLLTILPSYAGTVEIDRKFQGSTKHTIEVPPREIKIIPIERLNIGDQITAQVDASNEIYGDITVCIASEAEVKSYRQQNTCRGKVRTRAPLVVKDQAQENGAHFLILDNSYAAIIKKKLTVEIVTNRSISDQEIELIKAPFLKTQLFMEKIFENSAINIYVKPCGQANAFSSNKTADITLCSELIHDLLMHDKVGTLLSILLHEYGHSMLNRWGEPGSSEEDMADQFATVMLLRGGDQGRKHLQEWIAYWLQRDSHAEARNQLRIGDTHTLSIQRARNIQQAINYPEEFTRRWNKMLYRNMTRGALENISLKPSKSDDVDLARESLQSKVVLPQRPLTPEWLPRQ